MVSLGIFCFFGVWLTAKDAKNTPGARSNLSRKAAESPSFFLTYKLYKLTTACLYNLYGLLPLRPAALLYSCRYKTIATSCLSCLPKLFHEYFSL